MKPGPFGERVLSILLVLVRFPIEHSVIVLKAHALAECFYHSIRVVQEVVSVHNADVHFRGVTIGHGASIGSSVTVGHRIAVHISRRSDPRSNTRPNLAK